MIKNILLGVIASLLFAIMIPICIIANSTKPSPEQIDSGIYYYSFQYKENHDSSGSGSYNYDYSVELDVDFMVDWNHDFPYVEFYNSYNEKIYDLKEVSKTNLNSELKLDSKSYDWEEYELPGNSTLVYNLWMIENSSGYSRYEYTIHFVEETRDVYFYEHNINDDEYNLIPIEPISIEK